MADMDEPTGALVRPYAVTRGRTRPRLDIAIEALVETTVRGRSDRRSRTAATAGSTSTSRRCATASCSRSPRSRPGCSFRSGSPGC